MIVARVELLSNVGAREIGVMGIGNVSDLAPVSDYAVLRLDDRGRTTSGLVTAHERAAGFWPLVAAACADDLAPLRPPHDRAPEAMLRFLTPPLPPMSELRVQLTQVAHQTARLEALDRTLGAFEAEHGPVTVADLNHRAARRRAPTARPTDTESSPD